jgi:hypothetical protein
MRCVWARALSAWNWRLSLCALSRGEFYGEERHARRLAKISELERISWRTNKVIVVITLWLTKRILSFILRVSNLRIIARRCWQGFGLDAGRLRFLSRRFSLTAIAQEFHKSDAEVAFSITVTLAFRPVGAFIFGLMADRYGRSCR